MNCIIFENIIIERVESLPGYKLSNKNQDLRMGCDFYYYGLPIDVTLQDKKSLSTPIGRVNLIDDGCLSVNVSIRWGNSHTQFKTPVIVIHFSLTDIASALTIAPFIDDVVLDKMTDMYWAELDRREDKRA